MADLPRSWLDSVQGDLLSLGGDHSSVGWTNGWGIEALDVVNNDVWVGVLIVVLLISDSSDASAQLLASIAHIDTEGALVGWHLVDVDGRCGFVTLVSGLVGLLVYVNRVDGSATGGGVLKVAMLAYSRDNWFLQVMQ